MNGSRQFIRGLVAWALYIACTTLASAQTGGPAQPEFSNFEPTSTDNMVNTFDGSFTYNIPVLTIPGPDGSGYALSLSYHSGNTQESQASWVGYGWTLNPGAITRDLRGFPDDCNGSEVRYWNKTGKNITGAVTAIFNFEAFSLESPSPLGPAQLTDFAKLFNISTTLRYNNHKGFGYTNSITSDLGVSKVHPMAEGIVSLGYSVDDGVGSFKFQVNPGKLLSKWIIGNRSDASISETFKNSVKRFREGKYLGIFDNSVYSFSDALRPTNTAEYTGASYNVSSNLQVTGPNGTAGAAVIVPFFFPVGIEFGLEGNYTYQENIATDPLKAYGYLYSGNATEDDMMDYYAEKESPYSKRDQFLAIPFSNADNFTLSGEGLGGGFRAFSTRSGHFRPNAKTSSIDIGQLGLEFHAGVQNFGLGVDLGYGHHSLQVNRWDDNGINAAHTFGGGNQPHEGYFFRFNNDLGGGVAFSSNDDPVRAAKTIQLNIPTIKTFYPTVSPSISSSITSGAGRSSYLGFHTNREMMERSDVRRGDWSVDNVFYSSYNKDANPTTGSRRFVDRNDVPDGIGEFQVVNESGVRYVYGLPVYSRKEKNLSFGLQGLAAGNIVSNYVAYTNKNPNDASFVVGEERDAPYASMFLLTEITTPDYVDRTDDGPTPDDYGGYTKFNYRRAAGSDRKSDPNNNSWGADGNTWYKWRMPYAGLLYNRHSLSDPLDDQGTLASGEKELYYLESIETKTHIAKFITNTMTGAVIRRDAYEAMHDERLAMQGGSNSNAAYTSGWFQAVNKAEYLERIELYAKKPDGTLGELLQTVHLQYDYSLCRNLPNSFKDGSEATSAGKLTLRKIWSDYGTAKNVEINPYIFDYKYRQSTDYDVTVRNKYPEITGFGDRFYTGFTPQQQEEIQNPNYSPFNIDRWGFYQRDGTARHTEMKPWVRQSPDAMFDPAAWELKRIKLPSGGEIHVQYEQNDYAYVQDEPAMAMVSLKPSNTPEGPNLQYSLNLADLGIVTDPNNAAYSAAEIIKLRDLISKRFKEGKERIFFKYLYSLTGTYGVGENPTQSCKSEYIEGYVGVKDVVLENPAQPTGIALVLGASQSGYDIPRDVCLDFVQKERGYNVITSGDCDGSSSGIRETGPESFIRALWGFMGLKFLDPAVDCIALDRAHSYLRVPLMRPKLGGGVRVKRLLSYDPGIENGDAALYGREFNYRNRDGSSSGVATNEPSVGREENAVVKELRKRENQNAIEEIIAGEDREQFEGPVGESILPAPSIGYARVVAQDINRGVTTKGFAIHEFFTARDYPFCVRYKPATPPGTPADQQRPAVVEKGPLMTPMDDEAKDRDWVVLPLVFFNYSKSNIWLTQGYSFVLNHMHGQSKRQATYQGVYDPSNTSDNTWAMSTLQEYDYFAPGEPVPLSAGEGDIGKGSANGAFATGYPGREEEVIFESRWVADDKHDGNVETDGSIGLPAPAAWIPFVTLMPSYSYSTANLRTHVTTKVVRYPALIRKIRTLHDGIYETVENIAFDPVTGSPTVTRSYDGYNGLALQGMPAHNGEYRSYRFPASGAYEAMGQKAEREHTSIKTGTGVKVTKKYYAEAGTNSLKPYLSFTITDPALTGKSLGLLGPGDLLRLTRASDGRFAGLFHVEAATGAMVSLVPTSLAYDVFFNADVNVEILRSGRTNQLDDVRASISTYGAAQTVTYAAANAQSDPDAQLVYNARSAMVTKLNSVLTMLQTNPGAASASVTFTDDYAVLDIDGTCRARTAGQSWVSLTKNVSGGNVSLDISTDTRKAGEVPGSGITYPVNSHPLVADLNTMLDKAWAMEVQNLAVYQNNPTALTSCPPGDCPSATQPPVIKKVMAPADAPTAKAQILSASTIDAIKARTYQIGIGSQNGSAVLTTGTADIGSDMIVHRANTIAKTARFDIVIADPDPTHAGDKVVLSLKASVKDYTWGTTPYDPNAYGTVSSNPAEAGYTVTTTLASAYANGPSSHWKCVDGNGNTVGMNPSCTKTFNNAAPSPPGMTHEKDNTDLFAFFDKSHVFTQELARFGNDADGYLTLEFFDEHGCNTRILSTGIKLFTTPTLTEQCSTRLAASNNGEFVLDPTTWNVLYRESPGSRATPVPCLDLCDDVTATRTLFGVIDAAATAFSDQWSADAAEPVNAVPGANDYQTGERGKWRPNGTFVYKTDIIGGSGLGGPAERTYTNAGVYTDFTLFNTDGTNNSPKWLRPETVTRYSIHGPMLEGRDIAGNYSAMRLSKSSHAPVAVAANATYDGVMFESFEDGAGNASGTGHAGNNSLQIAPLTGSPVIPATAWTSQMVGEGAYIRVWSKVKFNNDLNRDLVPNPDQPFFYLDLRDADNQYVKTIPASDFTRIAQTGEWTLYMLKLTDAGGVLPGERFQLQFIVPQQGLPLGNEPQTVWIDDIRIEPVQAAMQCHVYDPASSRLVATFDDQHFGTYYQYNDEGKLIRKIRETINGFKTIEEAQYHLPVTPWSNTP